MTCWSLVLYRILAVAFWWAAACLFVWSWHIESRWGLAVFVAGVLAIGVGRGLWKGEAT